MKCALRSQQRHQNDAIDMEFGLVSLLLTYTDFIHCSGVSTDDFEQVNTGWDTTAWY